MKSFIAAEWTSMRLSAFLCSEDRGVVTVHDRREGLGVLELKDFAAELERVVSDWLKVEPKPPILLSGMISSNVGWVETGLAPCPAKAEDLLGRCVVKRALGTTLLFSPGLECQTPFGTPDLMRSEEAYLFGALSDLAPKAGRQSILCIVGKHPKWVRAEGKTVKLFFTSLQGDLAASMAQGTLVGKAMDDPRDISAWSSSYEFERGARLIFDNPKLGIAQALFSVRSLVVKSQLDKRFAAAYGHGLLIAADVRDSLKILSNRPLSKIQLSLIGSGHYADAYEHICKMAGISCTVFRDPTLFVKGLSRLNTLDEIESNFEQ